MQKDKQTTGGDTPNDANITEKTTMEPTPEENQVTEEKNVFRTYYVVYYIVGFLEIVLAFDFVFKLLGANPSSGFVAFVYTLGDTFMTPFMGIFSPAITQGVETVAVFDPAILIAMAVYAILGWGVVKLLNVITARRIA